MARGFVSARIVRVPWRFLLVGQPVHHRQDGFALHRVGIERQRLFGFLGCLGVVVIFEREAGQQLLGFHEFGIGGQGPSRQLRRLGLVVFRGEQSHA